ncbi:hypothetical protein QBC39DRAFT_253015 [Podospora conica]|nr:hypothetical protein QBC39DRAFT_253015 [Schizothecium conicum]
MSVEDDGKNTLLEIALQTRKSIVSSLIEIQGHQTPQPSAQRFLKNLECLRLAADNALYRQVLNAYEPQNRNYVALSYTWDAWGTDASPDDPSKKPFLVESSSRLEPSVVRATVLERIAKYMRAIGVDLLWIDRHCIPQDDEKDCQAADCDHESCESNRDGMQAMDMVYGLSKYPVALLGRPMESPQELVLLAKLLQGRLVSGPHRAPRVSKKTTMVEADLVLKLLDSITSDHWWRRGWPFQENYLGGGRMVLLIRHTNRLESLKQRLRDIQGEPLFGDVQGELCLLSAEFHEASTRFCLALRERLRPSQRRSFLGNQKLIDRVLDRAGRYTILLRPSEPMTPRIVRAIENRDMTKRWDRLAIASNCCRYSTRLNPLSLREGGHSLSLAMVAVCLLNGEILHNGLASDAEKVRTMTATQYIMARSFNEIRGPSTGRIPTFNKSCRFFDVSLTRAGVQTRGHLWKLGKVIDTSRYPPPRPRTAGPKGMLTPDQREYLTLFVRDLKKARHWLLAVEISQYLQHDIASAAESRESTQGGESFVSDYMRLMAIEIAQAISKGQTLRLGCLWNTTTQSGGEYVAVFTWGQDRDSDHGSTDDDASSSSGSDMSLGSNETTVDNHFAFTASRPGARGSEEFKVRDLGRHVSFEVRMETPSPLGETDGGTTLPSLRIQRWLSGLCFFEGQRQVPVVFPWPADLLSISP